MAMAAPGEGDAGRVGQGLLNLVGEVGKIGKFGGVFKKDCVDLSRRIQLLSHLLEEIRDFKGNSSSSSSSSSSCSSSSQSSNGSSSLFSCLEDLGMTLGAARRVILIGRSARKGLSDVVGKRIAFQFQYVMWQLEKVLGTIPYDQFDISDEVTEQVELVRAQLRRAAERKGSLDSKLVSSISYVITHTDEVDPQVLKDVTGKLRIENTGNSNKEIQTVIDMIAEVHGKTEHDVEQRKSLLEQLSNSVSSTQKINEVDPKKETLADTTVGESKKSDGPVIPDDFRCPISLELMRDPVIVATGQTYERSFIQRWIDCGNKTCPITQQKLENLILTTNYVLRSLIRQWCEANHIEQPLGLTNGKIRGSDGSIHEVSGDRSVINPLVRKLSSHSIEEQRSAAFEIRLLAKRSTDNRILITEAGAIPLLVNLLSIDDLRTQENAVTSLLNLSIYENNKELIMLAGAVSPILEVLKRGSMEARENAAATLFSLSLVDENKITIGASGAIKALVELLQRGSLRGKKDAATALFNLCIYQGNKARAVRAGILEPLMKMLTDSTDLMVDEALTILSVLASHQEGKVAIAKANAIPVLIDLLRTGLPRNKENAAAILLALCKKHVDNLACIGRLGAVIPLTELAKSGTDRGKRKASSLLEHLDKMKQM